MYQGETAIEYFLNIYRATVHSTLYLNQYCVITPNLQYDLPTNSTSIIHGLDIHGKLYIPPNYKSTLHTPFVFVQGELQMSDTNIISPQNESMKIVLTGLDNVTFVPADSNSNVNGTPFNAGFKPFLVAGGKLDIRGWDIGPEEERIASWAPVLSALEGPPPDPVLDVRHQVPLPIQPNSTTRNCPRVIAEYNFSNPIDLVWSGGDGALLTQDEDEGILQVSNLWRYWQGPRLDITKFTLDCPLRADVDYLITLRMKIEKEGYDEGEDMKCHNTTDSWGDCPRMMRKIMFKDGSDKYSHERVSSSPCIFLFFYRG